jgi:hypothetical protein
VTGERIEGVVAAILSNQELVINRGSDHGVSKGMKFAVLNRSGLDITDPETNEELGSVDVPKVIVEASRVQPKLTVAKTFRKRRVNIGGHNAIMGVGRLFEPPKWQDELETLRIGQMPQVEELAESESYVNIGDPVVQVKGDDYLTGG